MSAAEHSTWDAEFSLQTSPHKVLIVRCIPGEETEAQKGHPQLERGETGSQNQESAQILEWSNS